MPKKKNRPRKRQTSGRTKPKKPDVRNGDSDSDPPVEESYAPAGSNSPDLVTKGVKSPSLPEGASAYDVKDALETKHTSTTSVSTTTSPSHSIPPAAPHSDVAASQEVTASQVAATPPSTFLEEEGLEDLSELSLWKVSELIIIPQCRQLGRELDMPPAQVANMEFVISNDPDSKTESIFKMLRDWQRNQLEGESMILYTVLAQKFGFEHCLIIELFGKEDFCHKSESPQTLNQMQLWYVAAHLDILKYIPFGLRLSLSYNDLSSLRNAYKTSQNLAFFRALAAWQNDQPGTVDQRETLACVLEACKEKKMAYQVRKGHLDVSNNGKALKIVPQDQGAPLPVHVDGSTVKCLTVTEKDPRKEAETQAFFENLLEDLQKNLLIPNEDKAEFREKLHSIVERCKNNARKIKRLRRSVRRKGMYDLVGISVASIHVQVQVYADEGLEWLKQDLKDGLIGQRLSDVVFSDDRKGTVLQVAFEETDAGTLRDVAATAAIVSSRDLVHQARDSPSSPSLEGNVPEECTAAPSWESPGPVKQSGDTGVKRSTGVTLHSGIDEKTLMNIAEAIGDDENLTVLGLNLGFKTTKVSQYVKTNRDPVTDSYLHDIVVDLPCRLFSKICEKLGWTENQAQNELVRHKENYHKAYMNVLQAWKNRDERTKQELFDLLKEAGYNVPH